MQEIGAAQAFISRHYAHQPEIGVVLGSGLSNFRAEMEIEAEIDYASIPHFPKSTVEGHSGKLLLGEMRGKKVVAMSGRFHYYEGYEMDAVVFPVRTFGALGIKNLILTNAAGSLNSDMQPGSLMLISSSATRKPQAKAANGSTRRVMTASGHAHKNE